MALSPLGENTTLSWLLTTGTPTRPTAWFIALHAGANGGSGAANEIPTASGYGRQGQTFSLAGNVATGVANLTFGPATVAWGSVTDFSLWTAATAGTCLWAGTLTAPITYAVGDSATLAGSATTFTLT